VDRAEIFFVTRLKENARYEVLDAGPLPANRNIRADDLIQFTGDKAQKDCPYPLRRVVVWDAVADREIVLLTNLLEFGSTTIAAIYKDRWEIELFFKALKQNLKVKSFVGTSENALRIQIWTALIAILLLKWVTPSVESEVVSVEPGLDAAVFGISGAALDMTVTKSLEAFLAFLEMV
jgi:IS4 transposase